MHYPLCCSYVDFVTAVSCALHARKIGKNYHPAHLFFIFEYVQFSQKITALRVAIFFYAVHENVKNCLNFYMRVSRVAFERRYALQKTIPAGKAIKAYDFFFLIHPFICQIKFNDNVCELKYHITLQHAS